MSKDLLFGTTLQLSTSQLRFGRLYTMLPQSLKVLTSLRDHVLLNGLLPVRPLKCQRERVTWVIGNINSRKQAHHSFRTQKKKIDSYYIAIGTCLREGFHMICASCIHTKAMWPHLKTLVNYYFFSLRTIYPKCRGERGSALTRAHAFTQVNALKHFRKIQTLLHRSVRSHDKLGKKKSCTNIKHCFIQMSRKKTHCFAASQMTLNYVRWTLINILTLQTLFETLTLIIWKNAP